MTDWIQNWSKYQGEVRVILDDTSVAYGTATGVHYTEVDNQLMHVILDGAHIWIHPRHVEPIGDYN